MIAPLFERSSAADIWYTNRANKKAGLISVHASWDGPYPAVLPCVHVAFGEGPFSVGLHIPPVAARNFARSLLAAADVADATEAALDAELRWRTDSSH